jgi:predicted  nucleic acid-binding Zn-ribbon protein
VLSHVIAPPPPPLDIAPEDLELWEPPVPAGKVLLLHMAQSAADSDAAALTAACRVLDLLLLHGGGTTQEIALRVPLCLREGEQPLPLLQCVLLWLEEAVMAAQEQSSTAAATAAAASTAAEVLLQLLCRWLYGCSTAVSELLANPASLLIVDIAAQRNRGGNSPPPSAAGAMAAYSATSGMATVRGLACLLLGLILEYVSSDNSSTAVATAAAAGAAQQWDRATVLSLIERRVGITQFTAAIDALRSTYAQRGRARRRKSAADSSSANVDSTDSVALDASFESLLHSAADIVRRRVVTLYSGSDTNTAAVQSSDAAAGATASTADSTDTATAATATAAGDAQAVYRARELISLQEAELQRLRQQLAETESRIPSDDGSASAAERALLARAEQAEAVAATATAAQARAQQLEGETRGLSLALTAQERLLSERDTLVSSLQRQLAAAASGSASEREQELLLQLEELRTELARSGAQCDALQHDLARATEASDTADQYADDCLTRVTALESELAQATTTASDVALLERRLADASAWSAELESTLSVRCAELDAVRQRLAAAENHSSSSNGAADSSSDLAAVQLRLGRVEAELAAAAQEVAVLRGQRADRAALQQQLDSVSAHCRQLEQQVSSLQRELAVARAQQQQQQQQQAAAVVPQQQQSQQQLAELQRQCQLRQQQLEAALQELGHSEELREHAATELAQLREALQHSESNAAAAVAAAQQAEARTRALQSAAAATAAVKVDSKPVVVAGLNETALEAVVSEHSDLLVMLAQSQIEREQLIAALVSTGGKGVVAHALQLTQRAAQARFGQYVDYFDNT